MLSITPVPALRDNYVWVVGRAGHDRVVIIDPGAAAPVLAWLEESGKRPAAILVTHHHHDHVGGIKALIERHALPVYAPRDEPVATCTHAVDDGARIRFDALDLELCALHVPGHTLGAMAYFGAGFLFSGDTLFAAGCGRLYEGTAAQMHASLSRLAALPEDTQLCCGHEYTERNLEFACVVEPDNAAARARLDTVRALRVAGRPTLPCLLTDEHRTNPFLRVDHASVRARVEAHCGRRLDDAAAVFAVLRSWKDGFA